MLYYFSAFIHDTHFYKAIELVANFVEIKKSRLLYVIIIGKVDERGASIS
jgi:hypothetical protein